MVGGESFVSLGDRFHYQLAPLPPLLLYTYKLFSTLN